VRWNLSIQSLNPGSTQKLTSSDTAVGLPSDTFVSEGKPICGCIILVEIAPIRCGLNVTPTQAGLGMKFEPGWTIVLQSNEEVKAFQYISAETGVAATLQYTPQYPIVRD